MSIVQRFQVVQSDDTAEIGTGRIVRHTADTREEAVAWIKALPKRSFRWTFYGPLPIEVREVVVWVDEDRPAP